MSDLSNITQQILAVVDALDDATHDFAGASMDAAVSESRFKAKYSQAMVSIAEDFLNRKSTAAEREARAMLACRAEYETQAIHRARAEAAKQAIYSLRARLDALRTLNANVRTLTEPGAPT